MDWKFELKVFIYFFFFFYGKDRRMLQEFCFIRHGLNKKTDHLILSKYPVFPGYCVHVSIIANVILNSHISKLLRLKHSDSQMLIVPLSSKIT